MLAVMSQYNDVSHWRHYAARHARV